MSVHTIGSRISYTRTLNGTDVYLLPTRARDIVVCELALVGGHYMSPVGSSLTLHLAAMIPGSTKRQRRAQMLGAFGSLGAAWSFSVGDDRIHVELISRAEVFPKVFRMLIAALATPTFPDGEFAEAHTRLITAIRDGREDTSIQARSALMRALYRKGHPHWEPSDDELLLEAERVTRSGVAAFWRDMVSSVGAVATIAGDISPEKLMPELEQALTLLPKRAPLRTAEVYVDRTNVPTNRQLIQSIPDKMNVDAYLGIPLTLTRNDPDFVALDTAAQVLGGGSTGRLFNTLRTKMSLTYGAGASVSGFGAGYPGYLLAHAIFPNDVFARALPELERTVRTFVEGGITAKELVRRKEEVAGRYQVGLSTTRGICGSLHATVLSGRSPSYLDEYPDIVKSLTLREVNEAVRSRVDAKLLITSSAGAVDPEGKALTQNA